jgi:N-acyl-D-aspartate/D-glutamate deacylase
MVTKRALLSLEEAVHQLTDVPASLFGLRGRGRLSPGWAADLVVFDPATVEPLPLRFVDDLPAGSSRWFGGAKGIEHVYVNGLEVVRNDILTGDLGGRLLRSGRDTTANGSRDPS